MGYRANVFLCESENQGGGSHDFGGVLTSQSLRNITQYGVSQRQYCNIVHHGATKMKKGKSREAATPAAH